MYSGALNCPFSEWNTRRRSTFAALPLHSRHTVSGGRSEASILPLVMAGFSVMGALSTRNDAPQKASRPFDKDRDGFVASEGAAVLLLESIEHARARGAKIYGEVLGYGTSADAYHISMPAENGVGAAKSMQAALSDAGIAPSRIGYINAHGTSTPLNDKSETAAIKTARAEQSKLPERSRGQRQPFLWYRSFRLRSFRLRSTSFGACGNLPELSERSRGQPATIFKGSCNRLKASMPRSTRLFGANAPTMR